MNLWIFYLEFCLPLRIISEQGLASPIFFLLPVPETKAAIQCSVVSISYEIWASKKALGLAGIKDIVLHIVVVLFSS